MEDKEEKIEAFWSWFIQNESVIKACVQNVDAPEIETIVEDINNFILSFGAFGWDVGLDDSDDWFFTISPNNNMELFKMSKEIIESAPSHLAWNFYASRQAKKWDRIFSVYDHEMEILDVDASNWHYIINGNRDSGLEIVLETPNLEHIELEIIDTILNMFLTNEIGESVRIEEIESVKYVFQFEPDVKERRSPIGSLKLDLN